MIIQDEIKQYLMIKFKHGKVDHIDPQELYKLFPNIKKGTVRQSIRRFKKRFVRDNAMEVKTEDDNVTKKGVTKESAAKPVTNPENDPLSKITPIPPPSLQLKNNKVEPDTDKITDEIVEKWIIQGDDRARLGMEFLKNKNTFARNDKIDDDDTREFKEFLELIPLSNDNQITNTNNDNDTSNINLTNQSINNNNINPSIIGSNDNTNDNIIEEGEP